jgi:hypothetical protein
MMKASLPSCHLGHVPGPDHTLSGSTAVWICEYPYRTMRAGGPSQEDCGDCPIFKAMRCGTVRMAARPAAEAPAIRLVAV